MSELMVLKEKKSELQRSRQRIVDIGKSPQLLDRMISKVDREMNRIRREMKEQQVA